MISYQTGEVLERSLIYKSPNKPFCFKVESLFWHLKKDITLYNFLEDFSGVNKGWPEAVIE